MNEIHRTKLLEALTAAHAVAPKARSVEHGLLFAVMALRDPSVMEIPELRQLLVAVQGIPELEIFDSAEQYGPSGDRQVDLLFLIGWLLSRAQQVGPDTTLQDLEHYLVTDKVELTETLAVDGFQLQEAVSVAGFELVPWQSVPMTDTKWNVATHSVFGGQRPMMAVTRRFEIARLHLRPWDQRPPFVVHSIEPMQDLLRCVTAAAGAGVRLLHYWFEPPEGVPWAVSPIRFGIDGSGFGRPASLTDELLPIIRACAERFPELEDTQRQRLRVPLDRLNRSFLAGIRSVDAAIELGIALESLFAPNRIWKKFDKKLAKRAAGFMGVDEQDRARIDRLTLDAYDLRSCAVHAGRFDGDGADVKWSDAAVVGQAIQNGQKMAGRALVKVILDGEPDWQQFDIA